MANSSIQSLWRQVMTLSKVREGEKVVVLGTQSGRNRYKDVALEVTGELGGHHRGAVWRIPRSTIGDRCA